MIKVSILMTHPCRSVSDKTAMAQQGALPGFRHLRLPDLRRDNVALMSMAGGPEDISFSALEHALSLGWKIDKAQFLDVEDSEIVVSHYLRPLTADQCLEQIHKMISRYDAAVALHMEVKAKQKALNELFDW